MVLKDSGARREFESGAVRDVSEGKGRCDLLPLDVIGGYTGDSILLNIDNYLREGSPRALWRAIEQYGDKKGWNIYTSMLEASKQYEDGALKYEERNWEKGIPLHCFIDSGVRHYLKWRRGDDDEPHDRAFVWNILGALWTHKNKPELIDLPFIEENAKEEAEV